MYKVLQKGAEFFVEHVLTGEAEMLPAGGTWALGNQGSKVFAFNDCGAEAVWMADHLRTALWLVEGRVLVSMAARGEEPSSSVWLDNISRKFTVSAQNLKVKMNDVIVKDISIQTYNFNMARAGAYRF